ncbi:MAG: hypothetical protein DMG65_07360 [Candidatus Angelobacter sp. Gp1-AA117]|nr:MAG: hypothetical protein DMG65_07360 [Candidatus Angelobacter sp. Gp1-AA117]
MNLRGTLSLQQFRGKLLVRTADLAGDYLFPKKNTKKYVAPEAKAAAHNIRITRLPPRKATMTDSIIKKKARKLPTIVFPVLIVTSDG